jgi:hypothetical protein
MSEVMRAAMDVLYANADLGGLPATYFPPGSTIGVDCHVMDEPAETLSVLGAHAASQTSRIVSVRFPDGTVPVQNGIMAIGSRNYRIVAPEPGDDLHITYRLDMEQV